MTFIQVPQPMKHIWHKDKWKYISLKVGVANGVNNYEIKYLYKVPE